jgi:hypothetical protein
LPVQQQPGFYQSGPFQRPPPPPPAAHFMMQQPFGPYVPPFAYPGEPNHPAISWNKILSLYCNVVSFVMCRRCTGVSFLCTS